MSVGYCTIAVGMSTATALSGGAGAEGAAPPRQQSSADKTFGVLNALGGVAFTFGGQAVLPEIQVRRSMAGGGGGGGGREWSSQLVLPSSRERCALPPPPSSPTRRPRCGGRRRRWAR